MRRHHGWPSWVAGSWLVCAVGLAGSSAAAAGATETSGQPAPDLKTGRAVYAHHCARCHGDAGDGAGPDATHLYPKPRNLTLGTYKFRSTASGTPPTNEDLFRTLTNGLPGSGMPAWGGLSEDERWQLVHYVKQFSTTFTERTPEPVPFGVDPGPKGVDVAKGRAIYEKLQCAACHGKFGRGDGPSAASLTDDWGQPTRPANLTQGWTYRGGDDPRAIYLRFTTGIDGSPMPSYADAASEVERWQLAHYVHSLQEPPHWEMTVQALLLYGALPTAATDPVWAQAPVTDVGMAGLVYAEGAVSASTVKAVRVQALANADEVLLRLTWDDPSASRGGSPDALAVAFHPGSDGTAPRQPAWYTGTGARDLCYWSADRNQTREQVVTDLSTLGAGSSFGTLLASASSYNDGRWTLLMRRPRRISGVAGAAVLAGPHLMPVALAVWDGERDEHGRKGAFSTWLNVVCSDGTAPTSSHH